MVVLAGMAHGLNSTAVNKGYMVFLLPVSDAFGIGRIGGSIVFSLARAGEGPFGAVAGWFHACNNYLRDSWVPVLPSLMQRLL